MPSSTPFSRSQHSLLSVTNLLLSFDKEFSLPRLKVLLLICKAGKEGALVRDLVKATGYNQSTISRILSHLADKPLRGQRVPLNWVRMEPDYEDPRRVRIFMTPQGEQVMSDLHAALD